MSLTRFEALAHSNNRTSIAIEEKGRRSDLFGNNVFNDKRMLQYLTKDALVSAFNGRYCGEARCIF
jgi:glutamine synthetase